VEATEPGCARRVMNWRDSGQATVSPSSDCRPEGQSRVSMPSQPAWVAHDFELGQSFSFMRMGAPVSFLSLSARRCGQCGVGDENLLELEAEALSGG